MFFINISEHGGLNIKLLYFLLLLYLSLVELVFASL